MNEEKTTEKVSKGTWWNLPDADDMKLLQEKQKKPIIKFELNKEYIITFNADFEAPIELFNEDGSAYYLFEVMHEGQEKVFFSSAWTLLGALKKHTPLNSKTLKIKKQLTKGKQYFYVEEVKQ